MAIVPSRSTGSFREEEDRDAGARRVFGEIREREIDTRARLPDDVRADPEAAARARKAARFTGTSPVAIERSMAEFDQRQRISSVESAMRESERMRRWFTGEGNARVSHDDVPALREVASTYDNADEGGFASWVGDQLSYLITTKVGTSGTYQADENTRDTFVAEAAKDEGFVDRMLTLLNRGNTAVEEGLLNAIAQTTGSPRARRAAEVWRGASTAKIAGATTWEDVKANPFSPSTIGGYVLDAGVESLPYMATAAVPYAGVAIVATSQSGNIAADRAENNGGRRGDANIWDFITAAPYGVTSAVLERIGIEAIFAGAGRSAARRIAGAAGGEAVTEFAQGNVEYAGGTIGTEAGFDWRESLERGFAGALAGGPFGGAIRTGVEIASAGSTRVVQYAQARASERLVDDIFTAASKSKLRLRDPDLFAEFMATQAQGTPAENLYVNGDVLRSLFQDEAGNPIEPGEGSVSWEEMLPDFWDQLAQADQTGGDVVIPMARAAAYLAGTPEWEIIKGASRVAPGGLSPNEAGSLEADWADVIEDMGRRAYAEARADVEAEGPRARVYNEVLSQARQAGFSLNASRAYADLWSERYQARAERLGGGTNAWQLFEESVAGIRQAMPGRVETYRRGDNMDVLINAMRGSAQPMMPEGEGLIDRLIRGGGVVDVNLETGKGGDIKAMGGDKVRKGGAFGRPLQTLIAQPDAAGEYDRSLTLDEWALNLWEEGYFGPREERPSVNELLDLIGDALRGEVIVPFDNRNSAAVETNNAIVQAADDLRRILEDAGLDPDTATREEIDAALAAYQASEEAGAFGFDQLREDIGWSPSRIRDLLSTFAYSDDPARTKAMAVNMDPEQFLALTVPDEFRETFEGQVTPLNQDRLEREIQPIFLNVVETDGALRIIGHEGRHRMAALRDAGIRSAPVVLKYEAGRDRDPIETARLLGQQFIGWKVPLDEAEVGGLEPLAYGNRDVLAARFGEGRFLFQTTSEGKPLVTVHNLSAENFRNAEDLGGLAAPSIAVIRADIGFDNFGEITLIARPDMIDPARGRRNGAAFNADVYSPRQPRAQFDLHGPTLKKLEADLRPIAEEIGDSWYSAFDTDRLAREGLSAITSSPAAKLAFLRSLGENVEMVRRQPDPADPRLIPFAEADGVRSWQDVMLSPGFEAAAVEVELEQERDMAEGEVNPERLRMFRMRTFEFDDAGNIVGLTDWRLRDHAKRAFAATQDPEVDRYGTQRAIEKQVEEVPGREGEFRKWVHENYAGLIYGRFFETRDTGRRKAYTMENLVREMTRTIRDGEGYNYGIGSLRSNVAKQFRSLAEIKADRDAIIPSAQMDAVKEDASNAMFEILEKFRPYHRSGDDFGFADIFTEFLKDLAKGKVREWQTEIFTEPAPDDLLNEARTFLDSLRDLPTEYFEVKMQRAVGFDEFAAAVVPSDIDADVLARLRSYGLTVETYERGGTRAEAIMRAAGSSSARALFQSGRGDARQADLFSSDPAFDPPAAAPASKPVAQPLVRDDAPGRYATRTEVVQENVREIGAARVTTVEEAAQALAYLGRSAVERVDALVTDADGNPLAIVGAAKGGISEAPVYPSVIVSEAFRVNGAAKIWIAHNHPSGTAELSKADRNIIGRIREAFRGSGIEASEIFAIAGAKDGGREWVYGSADPERDQRGVTSPPAAGARVPVLERLFSQEEKLGPPIGSWSVAQDVIPSLVGWEPSIILLNNKNEPLAVVPFDPREVGVLRGSGRMDALYRALSMANASAAFIVHDGTLQAEAGSNLAGFLNASDVMVHDILALRDGTLTSWRASSKGNVGQKTFRQEGARGRIDFLNDGRAMITLFEGRDLSTLLHEGGHLWLEELRADARSLRSGSVFADWETVKAWMKRETGQEIRDDQPIPTEAHELWARAMERYFLEGKAPSTALRSAFASFRAWLVRIYKRVTGLNANLDDEVRQVFDRLIATDDAIRFAQSEAGDRALFGEAAAAGMTEAEFKAYQDLVSESRTEAYDKLLAKTMERVRIERTKEAKERRASIRIEVEREIRERPEWRALDLLRGNGESYMPVSKAGVVERVGRDALDLIPKGRPGKPTVSEGGLDPDLIAERAGFATGTDMLTVLTGIEIRRRELLKAGDRRSVLDEAIDVETDRRMTERYGDILSDGTIEEEALEIIHTDAGAQRLAAEVRQLAKQAGEAPTPEDAIRSWAERIVGEARIVDQASGAAVDRHRRAAEKAGRAAEQAYLNGDFAEAFRQKQRQQIANALFMASRAARERVEVIGKRLDRYAKARGFKGMAPEYLDRIHELLEQFDLRRRTEATLRERETFDGWAARQRDLGIDVQVPERLMLTGDKHFTRLTYDEVLALDDAVESLANLGRQKMRLKLDKEERDLEEMVGQAVQNAAGLPLGKFDAARNRARNVPREINAALVKIEFLADYMDDGDPNGVFNEVLVKGATRAANRLEGLQREVLDPLARLYLDMPAKERRRFAERIAVPEFISVDPETRARTPTVFMRSELIAVALNVGNKSNLEKMLQGETMAIETLLGERGAVPYAWTEEKVMAVLNRHLSESDWQFVETVWQRVNSLWPAIVEAERELTGMTPEKVEGRPVETRFGTIEGGYYPLVYDPNRSQMAANNADQEAADIFGSIGRFVGTPKGHTISRTTAALPITFSLERVLFSHVKKVSTRIAYGRYVRDVMKFAGHPKIRKLFGDTIGMEYHGQIKPWLKEQIQDASMDLKHLAALDRILRQFRINMTLVGLGFRFTTMLAQISGWHNSQAEIGTKWLARGVREMARNAGSIRSFVFEKSPELAGRAQAFDRDVRQFYQQASEGARLEGDGLLDRAARAGAAIGIDKFRAAAFWGIGMIDVYMVAMPTWLGAFHKALEERNMSEAEAIAFADKAVRKSQSAGRAKDLAAVQRGPEGIRVLTTFYSYFNVLYNKQFETLTLLKRGNVAGRAGDKSMKFAHWRQAAMNVWWIMLLAPVTSGLLTGDVPEEEERDLEGWTAWALNRIFFGLWAGVPGIRDIASKAQREIEGKFVGDVQSPFFTAFDAAERPLKDLLAVIQGDEPSERWIKNAIVAPGYFLGLPTGQIGTTAQYVADVAEGDQNPEGAGDILKGVIKGPQESQE
jgi:hypothetical protein